MRFTPIVTFLLATLSYTTAAPSPVSSKKCDLNAKGPDLYLKQDTAIKDFAQIFFGERDAKKAFDKYVPGWVQ
jgi:hypothetical protein